METSKTENTNVMFDLQDDVTDTIVNQDSEKYTKIDCLDEDDPIPGQKIVLLSFVSPEKIMNCNIRALKVRGVFDDTPDGNKEAEKKLKQLRQKDKYHDIFRGVVGKWMPICPTYDQVEEEKYANKDLDKIMKGQHESELKQKQVMKDLNELVGRHKDNLDVQKKQYQQRKKNKIKEALEANEAVIQKQQEHTEETEPPRDHMTHLNRNTEATKERLKKKIEETRAKKQQEVNQTKPVITKELTETVQKIKKETDENDPSKIKEDKEKIEQHILKMKELYNATKSS